MKLHIGCGQRRLKGWCNADYNKTEATDLVFDAQAPWPVAEGSVSQIFSAHMLEHLDYPERFFEHAWKALIPNGVMTLQLPYGASDEALADITHKRAWFPGTFCFLQPGYGEAIGNPQHTWAYPFAVHSVATRVPRNLQWLLRWPIRPLGIRLLRFLWGGYVELIVEMTALKTPDAVAQFQEYRAGNVLPHVVCAWANEWSKKGQPGTLKDFSYGTLMNTPAVKE